MEKHKVLIKHIEHVTHDVLRFITEKPEGYEFEPGQATEIAIDREGWRKEGRPFTFTSLPEDKDLEFIIKTYPEHDGATDKLLDLKPGDHFILHDVFGTITYQGKGTFIAGGAGITPFIAIFRNLKKKGKLQGNKLIFGNKTTEDIILHKELKEMFGDDLINVLSEEKLDKYESGFIDKEVIKKHALDFDSYFYVCGPPEMVDKTESTLVDSGASKDRIIKEGME
jgi:ferredoxin-NADP reductase